jgi:hypothetical protein
MTSLRIVAIVSACILAIQIVRTAAVRAYTDLAPETAAVFWPDHPAVEIANGMLEIARAARQHQPVNRTTFELIDDAAQKAPLSPQPFLVHGVAASLSGEQSRASRDFLEAQRRDPRSLAAAYFLAEYFFRTGQPMQGLLQTAILARLSPRNVGVVASYVAAYARDPAQWPQIRKLFRYDQTIEDAVLMALAHDSRNVRAVLALADLKHRQSRSPWLPILLQSLVDSGDYARARAVWISVARPVGPSGALVYDRDFTHSEPPPPFNWALGSSRLGIAERELGGGIHVIYYGEDYDVLASQLLLLTAGTYHLEARTEPGRIRASSLVWRIRCARSKSAISSATLAATSDQGWTFEIPQNCPAQWLELAGTPTDIAEQSEVRLERISMSQVSGRA